MTNQKEALKGILAKAGGARAIALKAKVSEQQVWQTTRSIAPRDATIATLARGGCDVMELMRVWFPKTWRAVEARLAEDKTNAA